MTTGLPATHKRPLYPSELDHRPWPIPDRPWVMAQTWEQLLFAHWPLPPAVMRAHIPPQLELDSYAGQAWIAVVPFAMTGIRLRGLPPVPGTSATLELNVRTYVRFGDRPGVLFFSLDAANPLLVAAARAWYHLPYFWARMRCDAERPVAGREAAGNRIDEHARHDTPPEITAAAAVPTPTLSAAHAPWIAYTSRRTHPGAPAARLALRYRPTGGVYHSLPGSLEHWLTERYCLYTVHAGRVHRGEIHHAPWRLQPAEAEWTSNDMTAGWGIRLPDTPPLLHFARRLEVVAWSIERVSPGAGSAIQG